MIKTDIEQLLNPIVTDLGYEFWGCEYLIQGKHSLLRVYIDKEDGIRITDCEVVSQQVSAMLDVDEPIPGNYSLEVSSPGIPRPLFYQKHYQRYLGKIIGIKLYKPVNGHRKWTGVLDSVNEATFILNVAEHKYEFSFSQVVKANLIGE